MLKAFDISPKINLSQKENNLFDHVSYEIKGTLNGLEFIYA